FSSRRRHTRFSRDWSSDVCSSDLAQGSAVSATTKALADTQAPSSPTNLAATAVSSPQIDLSWSPATDNVGVTGYRVYRDGTLAEIGRASCRERGNAMGRCDGLRGD